MDNIPTTLVALLAINAIGSIVDLVQFIWLLKLGWGKIKGSMEARIRAEILKEMKKDG